MGAEPRIFAFTPVFIHLVTMKDNPAARSVDSRVRIGHVHLKVADLERALKFYRDVLGFELTQRFGSQAAFLSAGGYHHHIGLNTWEARVVRRRPGYHGVVSRGDFVSDPCAAGRCVASCAGSGD